MPFAQELLVEGAARAYTLRTGMRHRDLRSGLHYRSAPALAAGGLAPVGDAVDGAAGARHVIAAICPWRAKSTASPSTRAASCGAWKPMLFSAAMKSSRHCARR